MKKVSPFKVICLFSAITTINSSIIAKDNAITQHAIAHHTVVKNLDIKIHECFQKYSSSFQDLTLFNLNGKVQDLNNLKEDLLFYMRRAQTCSGKHAEIKRLLEEMNFNRPMEAVQSFKTIISKLAPETQSLITQNLKDRLIRASLGL